jgi:hypothetical protein
MNGAIPMFRILQDWDCVFIERLRCKALTVDSPGRGVFNYLAGFGEWAEMGWSTQFVPDGRFRLRTNSGSV